MDRSETLDELEARFGLLGRRYEAQTYRLVSCSFNAVAAFVPFFMFSIRHITASPKLLQLTGVLYLLAATIGFFKGRIFLLVETLTKARGLYVRPAEQPRCSRYAIKFSLLQMAGRAAAASVFGLAWCLPHIIFCAKGIRQWWDLPVGVVALYLLIAAGPFLTPKAMIVFDEVAWIHFWFGKIAIPIDESLVLKEPTGLAGCYVLITPKIAIAVGPHPPDLIYGESLDVNMHLADCLNMVRYEEASNEEN